MAMLKVYTLRIMNKELAMSTHFHHKSQISCSFYVFLYYLHLLNVQITNEVSSEHGDKFHLW